MASWEGLKSVNLGGGGEYSYIPACSARRIQLFLELISKEICRTEHEYMNIRPPPQLTL